LKREALRAASFLWKNMAFSGYKSPLYEQSSRVIEKRKKLHWRNILGFQQCNFYSDIMFCCRDILLVPKSQLFSQNWPKLGSFLSITLQKK